MPFPPAMGPSVPHARTLPGVRDRVVARQAEMWTTRAWGHPQLRTTRLTFYCLAERAIWSISPDPGVGGSRTPSASSLHGLAPPPTPRLPVVPGTTPLPGGANWNLLPEMEREKQEGQLRFQALSKVRSGGGTYREALGLTLGASDLSKGRSPSVPSSVPLAPVPHSCHAPGPAVSCRRP